MLFDKVWVFGMSVSRADFSKFLYLVFGNVGRELIFLESFTLSERHSRRGM
jgi:hypothetical protein